MAQGQVSVGRVLPVRRKGKVHLQKGQAKLVRDLVRTGDPGGMSMVDEFHPRLDAADLDHSQRAGFKAADAHLIVARMYRLPNWNRLREPHDENQP